MRIWIRPACVEDCGQLALLKLQIWETTYRGIYPDSKIDSYNISQNEAKFRALVDHRTAGLQKLFVAVTDTDLDEGQMGASNGSFVQETREAVEFEVVDSGSPSVEGAVEFIVGYMSCGPILWPCGPYTHDVGLLYVAQKYQGFGIGRKFFLRAVEYFKTESVDEFIVSCNKYNLPALAFYLRMGGKVIIEEPDEEDRSVPQIKLLYGIV